MADKKAPAPAAAKGKAPKKKGKLGVIVGALLFGSSFLFILPTFLLVMVGMLPTFAALLTDDDNDKTASVAVGAMNCAGLVPFVIDLWVKGQTMPNALAIMMQMQNWLVIFGAAAIGKLIVFAVPQVIASMTLLSAERRLKLLKENLEMLKVAWGSDVSSTKPIDKMRPNE